MCIDFSEKHADHDILLANMDQVLSNQINNIVPLLLFTFTEVIIRGHELLYINNYCIIFAFIFK